MKSISTSSLLLAATAFPIRATAQTEVWRDDFTTAGVPDPRWWSHDIGGGGWGNNELQDYTPDNAVVKGGKLHITAERNGVSFTSARLHTQDMVEFRYGTIEARIRNPSTKGGLWPAFWTLGSNFPVVPWPECGELDIMEVGQGGAGDLIDNRVVSAAHWLHQDEQGHDVIASYPGQYDNPSLLNETYYIYSLEWTQDFLITRINGQKIWEMRITLGDCAECCTYCHELHQPHFVVLNLAVGGGFTVGNHSSCGYSSSNSGGGCPTPSATDITADFPATMSVDWVRIIDNGITDIYLNTPSPTMQPTKAPSAEPTTKAPTGPSDVSVVFSAPTSMPTFEPTTEPSYDDYDDYVDDQWQVVTGTGTGKGSSSSKSGKGGKGGKGGKSGKGGKRGKGGKSSKSNEDEIAALCAERENTKTYKGKSSKSKGKSSKSSKGKKGKSSKYSDNSYIDCSEYAASLRTSSLESSSATSTSLSVAVLLVAPALLFLA